jgi:hypothetical protein
MAITSTTNRVKHNCNGAVTNFAYANKFQNDTDLAVILTDSEGEETVLTLTTHYTVNGAGAAAGGSIDTVATYASGNTITIIGEPPETQAVTWSGVSNFEEGDIEDAFDKLTLLVQKAKEKLDRTIQLRKSSDLSGLELPADADLASKAIGFNADGDAIALYSPTGKIAISDFTSSQHDHSSAAEGGENLAVSGSDFTNSQHDHGDAAGGGNTLDTPTIVDMSNATHSHQNAAGGGVLAAPDITSFANAQHDHSDAAGGGDLTEAASALLWFIESPVCYYLNKKFDASAQVPSGGLGFHIGSSGTKLYILRGSIADTVYQYTMSTAWDITTATYDNKSKSVASESTAPQDITFSDDGTKMYMMAGAVVYQYTLSTPWDVSTASYASKSKDVSSEEANARTVAFGDSGSKMYIAGTANVTVYQYTVSTPWDVSTASYATKSKDVSSEDANPWDIEFNSDGTKMFIVGLTNDTVFQYNLTTGWDVSTATYASKSYDASDNTTVPQGLYFKSDGKYMYVFDAATAIIYQYSSGILTTEGS